MKDTTGTIVNSFHIFAGFPVPTLTFLIMSNYPLKEKNKVFEKLHVGLIFEWGL